MPHRCGITSALLLRRTHVCPMVTRSKWLSDSTAFELWKLVLIEIKKKGSRLGLICVLFMFLFFFFPLVLQHGFSLAVFSRLEKVQQNDWKNFHCFLWASVAKSNLCLPLVAFPSLCLMLGRLLKNSYTYFSVDLKFCSIYYNFEHTVPN